ncbi:hypothetical protein Aab01nite_56790 [Paractinoplanes abujensis]|uniref:HEAT repeat protein n=1 Tax=Paractinoplanes abujensis TaxID=882441 RepID=A0A7W7G396_9ACTN|nr:HEAT repeat domain-containing protein [Actinoplanes abujensis]MBB4696098.1 HEAT repeat protein [Actinoplanes abujensis]GID22089.1 hypothetical protein Aab01nite_56790 [Actinoplanes abujensis]
MADDPEAPVPYLVALTSRAGRSVFDQAAALLQDSNPVDRELAARVLRELGPQDDTGHRPHTTEAVPLLRARLKTEPDPRVIGWLISALAYNTATESLEDVLSFAAHADSSVRFQVAAALTSLTDPASPEPRAVDALLSLSGDDDPDTRFYALYALVEEFTDVPSDRLAGVLEALSIDPDPQIRDMARSHRR